jgi:hypothetical protein
MIAAVLFLVSTQVSVNMLRNVMAICSPKWLIIAKGEVDAQ